MQVMVRPTQAYRSTLRAVGVDLMRVWDDQGLYVLRQPGPVVGWLARRTEEVSVSRAWGDPFVYRIGPFHWAVVFSAIGGNLRPDIVYHYRLKRRAYAALDRWESLIRTTPSHND